MLDQHGGSGVGLGSDRSRSGAGPGSGYWPHSSRGGGSKGGSRSGLLSSPSQQNRSLGMGEHSVMETPLPAHVLAALRDIDGDEVSCVFDAPLGVLVAISALAVLSSH